VIAELTRLHPLAAGRLRAGVGAHVEHLVHVGAGPERQPLLRALAGEVESVLGIGLSVVLP
jgi:hypothetical protein